MKLATTLGIGLFLGTSATFAQDAGKPEKDAKSSETTQATKLAAKRDEVQKAERGLREAQESIQKAQREVQKAHREADSAAREQTATLRANLQAVPRQRMIVTRSAAGRVEVRPESIRQFDAYGMDLVEADVVLRSQLGLPVDQGLVVTQVVAKKPAEQAGMKLNDVLIKFDDKSVGKPAQVQKLFAKAGKGPIELDLIREGKPRKINIVRVEQSAEDRATTYWIGVPVAPVDATLRSHLTSLPEKAGLIAIDVVANSPAAKSGLKKNDILIRFNDQPVASQEALIEQVQKSEGKEIKVELLRGGKILSLDLTPEKRSNEALKVSFADPSMPDGFAHDQLTWYQPFQFKQNEDGSRSASGEVSPTMITVTPTSSRWPFGSAGVPAASSSELEKEMKTLTEQVGELRQAIEDLKKALPAGKDSKTSLHLLEPTPRDLTFNIGAFW